MKFERAKDSDLPRLKEIWKTVFDNTESFIDEIFEERWKIDHCYVARDEIEGIVSVLHCLQWSFSREMNSTPISYIIGAATLPEFRNQGLMDTLIRLAHDDEGRILVINPGLGTYFLRHGFYHTTSSVCYSIEGDPNGVIEDSDEDLSAIYSNATEKIGSIDRDYYAWKLIRENCKTVLVTAGGQSAYALIIGDVAFETMCEGFESARALKEKLKSLPITQVWMHSSSTLSYLFDDAPAFLPMGMSNEKNICSGLYIAQQF
ncbi:MAG: GNAT family N-acetyltransferase [Sphaerochaeta sp.]